MDTSFRGALTNGTVVTTLNSNHTMTDCGSIFMHLIETAGQELGIITTQDVDTIITVDNNESRAGSTSPLIASQNRGVDTEEKEMEQEECVHKTKENPYVNIVDDVYDQIMSLFSTIICGEDCLSDVATNAKRKFGILDDGPHSKVLTMPLPLTSYYDTPSDEGKVEEEEMEHLSMGENYSSGNGKYLDNNEVDRNERDLCNYK